jgi:hypothetical protein
MTDAVDPEAPWDEAYGSRFVTVEDLTSKPVRLRIVSGEWTESRSKFTCQMEKMLALHLETMQGERCRKPLALGQHRAAALKAAWGKCMADGQTWNGKELTVWAELVNAKPEIKVTPVKEK